MTVIVENKVARFMAHRVFMLKILSSMGNCNSGGSEKFGRNTFFCCRQYGVPVDDLFFAPPPCISRAVEARLGIRLSHVYTASAQT